MERIPNKNQHRRPWRRKFSHSSCRDSNLRPFDHESVSLPLSYPHSQRSQPETVPSVWNWNTDLVSPLEVFHFIQVDIKVEELLDFQKKVNAEACAAFHDGLIGQSETQYCSRRTVGHSANNSHFGVICSDTKIPSSSRCTIGYSAKNAHCTSGTKISSY